MPRRFTLFPPQVSSDSCDAVTDFIHIACGIIGLTKTDFRDSSMLAARSFAFCLARQQHA
jgi:hypothetical protein